MQPKVSFIVPVYRTEKYLDRCVKSLINQTCRDIEIILIDDGSPDKCPELCDDWSARDKRIHVIHKKNGGLSDSRNTGINMSLGEYLCFVDSDDFIENNLVETIYKIAKKNNADIVAYSNYFVHKDGKKKLQPVISSKSIFLGKEEMRQFFNESIGSLPHANSDYDIGFAPWGKIYRRNLFIDNRLSFKNERKLIYEDLMFLFDLIPCINIAVVENTPFYNYCQNDDSLTRSVDLTRFNRLKKQYYYLKDNNPYKSMIFNDKQTVIRFKRTMLSYIRNSIIQSNNVPNAIFNIKKICSDEMSQEILDSYPIELLPRYQFLFAWCLKKKLAFILFILVKLNGLRHV